MDEQCNQAYSAAHLHLKVGRLADRMKSANVPRVDEMVMRMVVGQITCMRRCERRRGIDVLLPAIARVACCLGVVLLIGCQQSPSAAFVDYCRESPILKNEFSEYELAPLSQPQWIGLRRLQADDPDHCLRLLSVLMLRRYHADVALHHGSWVFSPPHHPCVVAFYMLSSAARQGDGHHSIDAWYWVTNEAPIHVRRDESVAELVRRIQSCQDDFLRTLGTPVPKGAWGEQGTRVSPGH